MSLPKVVALSRQRERGRIHVPSGTHLSAQLIPFPSASGGLTARDTGILTDLILALRGEWRCRIERDGCGELWAAVDARQPAAGQPSAFLICRVEGRLLFIDRSLENRWRTLGFYDDAQTLASDLGDMVGWQ